ncbi:hypothetical protein DICVIV_11618 [Dictyocaulus viviparus]|uniref:Uncharacterized protein n=1 Tax=Dictyocaulus viviparus TaxID=29172 RepID=A0A0D8XJA0_DICVI|nr:hypothetical protein DICVIV_11618 [Dictyocaulus viviparus]
MSLLAPARPCRSSTGISKVLVENKYMHTLKLSIMKLAADLSLRMVRHDLSRPIRNQIHIPRLDCSECILQLVELCVTSQLHGVRLLKIFEGRPLVFGHTSNASQLLQPNMISDTITGLRFFFSTFGPLVGVHDLFSAETAMICESSESNAMYDGVQQMCNHAVFELGLFRSADADKTAVNRCESGMNISLVLFEHAIPTAVCLPQYVKMRMECFSDDVYRNS